MIKLQDFAKQQGVTDRAIQKHLKKYEQELDGLFVRKGPNGTWLSEEACDIIRSKMKSAPAEVYDDSKDREIARLQKLLAEKEDSLLQKEKYITALEAGSIDKQNRINELEQNQKLIEQKTKELVNEAVSEAKDILEKEHKIATDVLKEHYKEELDERDQKHQEELEAERTRKLSLKEAIKRVLG